MTVKSTAEHNVVRAALLLNHPVQHFAQGFRRLADDPRIRSTVYFWDAATEGLFDPGFDRHIQWDVDLRSGYDWWSPAESLTGWRRAFALLRRLKDDRPNVILSYGWGCPITRLGILYGHVTETPLLFYGDTNRRSAAPARRRKLRGLALHTVLRLGQGAISTGAANREFYLSHGLRPDRIHRGVMPVDVASFAAAGKDYLDTPRATDGGRPFIIGFAGKFRTGKAVDDLIKAAARLSRPDSWELWLVGDGPLRPELEALVAGCGISDRVRFLGFNNTSQIPTLLAAMDVLALPSRWEPRGLVAIEAMAAGVAVVVSSATGVWGADDVVEHNRTGLVYPAGDIEALAFSLQSLMLDPALRCRLAAAGQARAMRCSSDDYASTAAVALLAAAGHPCEPLIESRTPSDSFAENCLSQQVETVTEEGTWASGVDSTSPHD